MAGYEEDDELAGRLNSVDLTGNSGYKRARVLCSYDAKDGTELNLTSNEVVGCLDWQVYICWIDTVTFL